MMKKSDAIILLNDLLGAGMDGGGDDLGRAVARLRQIEPYLAGYLDNSLAVIAGRLSLSGASSEAVRSANVEIMSLLITLFEAQRWATLRLWRSTHAGTPLAQLETLKIDPRPKK